MLGGDSFLSVRSTDRQGGRVSWDRGLLATGDWALGAFATGIHFELEHALVDVVIGRTGRDWEVVVAQCVVG